MILILNITFLDNFLPEEFLLDLEQKLDVSLASISSKYDIKFQVEEAQKCLTKQWDNIQSELLKYSYFLKN